MCVLQHVCSYFFTLALLRYYLMIVTIVTIFGVISCHENTRDGLLGVPRIGTLVSTDNISLSQTEKRLFSVCNQPSIECVGLQVNWPYSCRGPRITLNIASQLTAADHWGVIARARQQLPTFHRHERILRCLHSLHSVVKIYATRSRV